jgi:hypothetical protein
VDSNNIMRISKSDNYILRIRILLITASAFSPLVLITTSAYAIANSGYVQIENAPDNSKVDDQL